MKMKDMDVYFASKGFTVEREYHKDPTYKSGGFYTFDISRDGITMHRVYKWPDDQRKFMDKLIADFNGTMGEPKQHPHRDDSVLPRAIAATLFYPTSRDLAFREYCENDVKTTEEMWAIMNPFIANRYGIRKVIFNDPATIVYWSDKSKTVVKVQEGDVFDPEKGLAMAIAKKAMGNKGNYCNEFKKWLPKEKEPKESFAYDFKLTDPACVNVIQDAFVDLGKRFRLGNRREKVQQAYDILINLRDSKCACNDSVDLLLSSCINHLGEALGC